MEDLDVVKEFIIESTENLSRLDREMVEVEQRPNDASLLASIFRTIHTIKGTCGFFGFTVLETITHQAENILSQVRDGERQLTPELVSLVLETVDAIKAELNSIEATGQESGEQYLDLVRRQVEASDALPVASKDASERTFEPAYVESATGTVDRRLASDVIAEKNGSDLPADSNLGLPTKANSVAESTIRVDVAHLDKLLNLVGELVLARNQILQFKAKSEDAQLDGTSQRLNLITTELQESVMKMRMQPIGVVWAKLPRVVRDLSAAFGKQIGLQMQGAETELDKTIIEAIKDPLTHIVRNSCDHGIETPAARLKGSKPARGTLVVSALHEGGNVTIAIADDGAGINPQAVKRSAIEKGLVLPEQAERMGDGELINLVFLPGFSTAAKVSHISGRGVGMDVVKTNIEKIGGTVELISTPGQGTTVRVKIPLTLTIIPGLVVTSGGERFIIPQASLIELVRIEGEGRDKRVEWIHGAPVCRRRGRLLPLVFLNETLKLEEQPGGARNNDVFNVVVVQAAHGQFGLVVDAIDETQEIVVKPLGKRLKSFGFYAGATIMGDGKIALILDVTGLAERSGLSTQAVVEKADEPSGRAGQPADHKQALLLFRVAGFERLAMPLSVVARLEEIPRRQIEKAAGKAVVQYRGEILTLLPLSEYLGSPGASHPFACDPVQVIVFASATRRIGLVVDQILDIIEDTVSVTRPSTHPGLLGSAVIGGHVTDFLDLQTVIRRAEEGWFRSTRSGNEASTVLIADTSAFSRTLIRSGFEIAGYRVIEAASTAEVMQRLGQHSIDVIVTMPNLPGSGGVALPELVKADPQLKNVRVVAVIPEMNEAVCNGFDEYLVISDQISMLQSIEKLAHALEGANSDVGARS